MRSLEELRQTRGFVLRDVLIGSLIVGLSVLFVETHLNINQAIWKGALCQSNARQVGLALYMYAADYDEHLPPNAGSFDGLVSSTHPYLRDYSRFYCPKTNVSRWSRKLGFRVPALYAGRTISAGWSDPYLGGQPADPARTILLYESDSDADSAIVPSYRHNGGAVCLLFTGQTAIEQDTRPRTK
jgi:hypothetical protein